MTKVIFLFVLISFFGISFFSFSGCGGSTGTGADFNTNTPVPTFIPVATATPMNQLTTTIQGTFLRKDKTTPYNDPNLVVLIQSSALTSSGVQTNYSTLVHVAADGKFTANGAPYGILFFYGWVSSDSYNNDSQKKLYIASSKYDATGPELSVALVDGEFINGNPPPQPTTVPTVIPTTIPTSVPTAIPAPLPGCAGLVVNVVDDSGSVYNNAEIRLEDVTDVKYRADFNVGEWHRIYNPIVPVVTLDGNNKLDLAPERTYNVLVFLSGAEMGSRVITTVANQTEALTIKIHSGSLFDIFILFDFKNTFSTGEYDPNGVEKIDTNIIFMPMVKISGDGGNYSKILPLSAHDNIIKWWQSPQKLYSGSYTVDEMKIKRSGAIMSSTPAGNFTVSGSMNLHLQENGPVLNGDFQTFLPGGVGIDHQYGTVTTGSSIYLNCPIFTDSQEKLPWGQDYVLGHEGIVVSDFSVINTGSDLSTGYLMTSESFLTQGLLRIWTNQYREKSYFPQNIQKEMIMYQYTNGTSSLRLFSKLFKSNNVVRYFSLTAGQADAINVVTNVETYAPKKMTELAQKLRQKQ